MKLYDTFDAQLKTFVPVNPECVSIYVCGATPYDSPHVGHLLSMLRYDLLRRFLLFKGYNVKFVTNFTDIDDKTINKGNLEGVDFSVIAKRYIPEYMRAFEKLRMHPDTKFILATDFIDQILAQTRILMQKGFAYTLEDGIYFEVSKFPDYGKLAKRDLESQLAGARVEVNTNKKAPEDFVLWKFAKQNEPAWKDSVKQIPDGRPGWHLECSAMIYDQFLGETIDIHGGGSDLIFPHHECEIAQSECAFDHKMVNHWLHNGLLNISGDKMSKSLGNFFDLQTLLDNYAPSVIRYYFTSTHYRAPLNFSKEALDAAKSSLETIQEKFTTVEFDKAIIDSLISEFTAFLDNDIDVSGALSKVFELSSIVNAKLDESSLSEKSILSILDFYQKFDSIFAVLNLNPLVLDPELKDMLEKRLKARQARDFKQADSLRRKIEKRGVKILDTKDGYDIKFN
jgi:cysteinyl-tRNA synthetase